MDDLGFGTFGKVVVVSADIKQGGGERVEDAFLREDAAEVVAGGRTLRKERISDALI